MNEQQNDNANDSWWKYLLAIFSKRPIYSLLCVILVGIAILIINQFTFWIGSKLPISIKIEYSDSINFWASIITLLGTLFLGAIAFWQNNEIIEINKSLQKIERDSTTLQILQNEVLIPFLKIIDIRKKKIQKITKKNLVVSGNKLLLHDLGDKKFRATVNLTLQNLHKSTIESFFLQSELLFRQQLTFNNKAGIMTNLNYNVLLFPGDQVTIPIYIEFSENLYNIIDNWEFDLKFDITISTLTGFKNDEHITIGFGKEIEYLYRVTNGLTQRNIETFTGSMKKK